MGKPRRQGQDQKPPEPEKNAKTENLPGYYQTKPKNETGAQHGQHHNQKRVPEVQIEETDQKEGCHRFHIWKGGKGQTQSNTKGCQDNNLAHSSGRHGQFLSDLLSTITLAHSHFPVKMDAHTLFLIIITNYVKMEEMRKKLKPGVVFLFFFLFVSLILYTRSLAESAKETASPSSPNNALTSSSSQTTASTYFITNALEMKPIIDVSGWQLPSEIDYDTLSQNISGVIVRVQSGSHTTKDNNASDENGLDKSYKTHIQEFQARNIPVAVYAYVTGNSIKSMEEEATTFYEASSPYKPTFYWLDVEEKTMEDMNAGVEAFRAKLAALGAKNIGIYVGTYFMEEHSISTENFDAVWIPTYGTDSGYYNAAPNTDLDYDLHQYTSQGRLNGFNHVLDLNLVTTLKDPNEVYQRLFTVPEE